MFLFYFKLIIVDPPNKSKSEWEEYIRAADESYNFYEAALESREKRTKNSKANLTNTCKILVHDKIEIISDDENDVAVSSKPVNIKQPKSKRLKGSVKKDNKPETIKKDCVSGKRLDKYRCVRGGVKDLEARAASSKLLCSVCKEGAVAGDANHDCNKESPFNTSKQAFVKNCSGELGQDHGEGIGAEGYCESLMKCIWGDGHKNFGDVTWLKEIKVEKDNLEFPDFVGLTIVPLGVESDPICISMLKPYESSCEHSTILLVNPEDVSKNRAIPKVYWVNRRKIQRRAGCDDPSGQYKWVRGGDADGRTMHELIVMMLKRVCGGCPPYCLNISFMLKSERDLQLVKEDKLDKRNIRWFLVASPYASILEFEKDCPNIRPSFHQMTRIQSGTQCDRSLILSMAAGPTSEYRKNETPMSKALSRDRVLDSNILKRPKEVSIPEAIRACVKGSNKENREKFKNFIDGVSKTFTSTYFRDSGTSNACMRPKMGCMPSIFNPRRLAIGDSHADIGSLGETLMYIPVGSSDNPAHLEDVNAGSANLSYSHVISDEEVFRCESRKVWLFPTDNRKLWEELARVKLENYHARDGHDIECQLRCLLAGRKIILTEEWMNERNLGYRIGVQMPGDYFYSWFWKNIVINYHFILKINFKPFVIFQHIKCTA